MDSKLFTLHTIETFWNKIKNKFYVKSANGIPKSDLDATVQSSLSKADTALQKHQDISGKLDKTGDASTTTVAFSAASARENVKTGEKLSVILGKIAKWFADLKTVAFTGSYNDLANKPTIPDVSGKQDKLTAGTNITISGNTISAKDTTYNDVTQSTHGLMTAADKKKLDGMDLMKYLHYNSMGNMAKDTWYKFASFTCTQYYNFSTAIFVAGFGYGDIRMFRITAGIEKGKPVASRIYLANITGNLIGNVGYVINGNTVNFFLRSTTNMYGYVGRIGTTAETGDFIAQTDLVAATTAEAASIVPFTAAGTDVAFSNHSNETDKISNGTLRSGFYVNAAANSTSGYTWFRMATCKISGAYETVNTTFLITNGMVGHALLSCGIRNDGTGKAVESCNLNFSARNGSTAMPSSMFRVVAINSSTGVTYELWGQISARWSGIRYTVLDERNISGGKYNIWTLESHSDADAKIAPTIGNYYVNSSDISVCATATKANEATTLTDSGWITCPLAVTGNTTYPSSSSSIKVRKYGKLVQLEAVVKYTTAFGAGHNVATIPEGYRPSSVQREHGIMTTAAAKEIIFDATLGVGGNLSFEPAGSSSSVFNPGNSYACRMTYFID